MKKILCLLILISSFAFGQSQKVCDSTAMDSIIQATIINPNLQPVSVLLQDAAYSYIFWCDTNTVIATKSNVSGSGYISGTLTTNYLPVANGIHSLTNSYIHQTTNKVFFDKSIYDYPGGFLSFNPNSRLLYDSQGSPVLSIAYDLRSLRDNTGTETLNWNSPLLTGIWKLSSGSKLTSNDPTKIVIDLGTTGSEQFKVTTDGGTGATNGIDLQPGIYSSFKYGNSSLVMTSALSTLTSATNTIRDLTGSYYMRANSSSIFFQAGTNNTFTLTSTATTATGFPINYTANYGARFGVRSMTDKRYVDSAITAGTSGSVLGTGTIHFIPEWLNSTTIQNSPFSRVGNFLEIPTGRFISGSDTTKGVINMALANTAGYVFIGSDGNSLSKSYALLTPVNSVYSYTTGGKSSQVQLAPGAMTLYSDTMIELHSISNQIRIRTGSPSAGKILTAVDGNGLATWSDPATSGTVKSVSGTTNRITSTGGTTPVIDISASYVGQSSITTLGTIITGTLGSGTKVLLGSDATGDIYYNGGSGALTRLGAGTSTYVLTANGAGAAPSWQAAGSSGVTTLAAIGSSANANGATISGSTLNLEPASPSFGGVVTTGAQTFAGVKTLTSAIFVTPALGTPASGVLTNCTGLVLTSGVTGILPSANGGTGVNNGSSTITLAGNLITTGAFNSTFAASATATYTLPTATSTLLANNLGISGGSTFIGGTGSGENETFSTTSHATKGKFIFGSTSKMYYDENAQVQFLQTKTTGDSPLQVQNAAATRMFSIHMDGDQPYYNISGSGTQKAHQFQISGGSTIFLIDDANNSFCKGRFSVGKSTAPTANIHVAASTATASTGQIKLDNGVAQTVSEAGTLNRVDPQLQYTNGGGQMQEIPQIQQSRVATQFDKTTATLANITSLTATLVAGKTYEFEANLYFDADATGGDKFAIAGTATATSIIYEIVSVDNSTSANTITSRQTALAGSAGQAGTTAGYCRIKGLITVNAAGTLTAQFAQNTANGTSSILVGSTFVTREML